MKDTKKNTPTQKSLFNSYSSAAALREASAEYIALTKTRVSMNHIVRDFLYSSDSDFRGISNVPEDFDAVIKASEALAEKVLEPIGERFGRYAITFAFQSRDGIEADWSNEKRRSHSRSSSPHQYDRLTWGDQVYARIDILPFCVEDGKVTKQEFGHWVMHNLDICLLMQWKRSNVFCITISPKPRRIWLEWGSPELGQSKRETFMGAEYWQNVWPHLPENERPKFGPSCTGGSIQWSSSK